MPALGFDSPTAPTHPSSFSLPPRLVDAQELALIVGVGKPHIRKLTRLTDMPRVKIGKRGVRYDAGAVLAWLQTRNGK